MQRASGITEAAELIHHVPGRLRLRLPFAKRNTRRLREIQDGLAALPGLRRVDVNTILGTALLQYNPALYEDFAQSLAEYGLQHDLFFLNCDDEAPCISETDRSVDRALTSLNRNVQQAMGNAINLKELLPIALGAYGLLFADRRAAAAQWISWLQFAFNAYINLHEEEPIAELVQKMHAMGARILDEQEAITEGLRAELAALRAELHALAKKLSPAH